MTFGAVLALTSCMTAPVSKQEVRVRNAQPSPVSAPSETPSFLKPIQFSDAVSDDHPMDCPCMMAIDYDALAAWEARELREKRNAHR